MIEPLPAWTARTVEADTEVENRYDRSAQVDQPGDEGRRSGQWRGPAIEDDLSDAAQFTGTGPAGRHEDEEPGGVGGIPKRVLESQRFLGLTQPGSLRCLMRSRS